jgi:hypothetical protein
MVTGREQWLGGEAYAFHSKLISDIQWYLASFQSNLIFDYHFCFLFSTHVLYHLARITL